MAPAILITIGVLALIGQYRDNWDLFWQWSPLVLIVIGVIMVLTATASIEGHVGPGAYYQTPPQPQPPSQTPPQAPPQR